MNIPNWFYDERVQQIAPEKLNLLLHLAAQLEGKTSQKEIMPVLIGAIASANRQNLMFSKDEFELIFKIMKEGKSVEEQQKMDETLQKGPAGVFRKALSFSEILPGFLFFGMSIDKLELCLRIQDLLAVIQSKISRFQIADGHSQQNKRHGLKSKQLKTQKHG